jgi:hypothetical protein
VVVAPIKRNALENEDPLRDPLGPTLLMEKLLCNNLSLTMGYRKELKKNFRKLGV